MINKKDTYNFDENMCSNSATDCNKNCKQMEGFQVGGDNVQYRLRTK